MDCLLDKIKREQNRESSGKASSINQSRSGEGLSNSNREEKYKKLFLRDGTREEVTILGDILVWSEGRESCSLPGFWLGELGGR